MQVPQDAHQSDECIVTADKVTNVCNDETEEDTTDDDTEDTVSNCSTLKEVVNIKVLKLRFVNRFKTKHFFTIKHFFNNLKTLLKLLKHFCFFCLCFPRGIHLDT